MKPRRIGFYTTSKCQLNCTFCAKSKVNVDYFVMSMEDFKKYAIQSLEFGIKNFEITPIVGDPLLDPLFIDRLKFLFDNGAERVISFTNLLGLSKKMLNDLDQFPKFRLNISIYGTDEESYLKQTNCEYFQKFIDNLKMLIIHISNKNSFKVGEINFRTKLCKTTLVELMVNGMLSNKLAETSYIFDHNFNWHELLNVTKTLTDPPIKREVIGVCRNLLDDVGIWPNGDIGICAGWFDLNKRMILGNLNEMTITEIFNDNGKYSSVIKEQKEGMYRSLCSKCSYLTEDENPFINL